MSFQSSRTNVSCVNPTARLFFCVFICFLFHLPLVTLGLSKRAYLDTTRNHTDLVFTSGKQQVKTETWRCLMVCLFYTLCVLEMYISAVRSPCHKKKKILSNQDSQREKKTVSVCITVVEMVHYEEVVSEETLTSYAIFFFSILLVGFFSLYFIFRLTENMAAWSGQM